MGKEKRRLMAEMRAKMGSVRSASAEMKEDVRSKVALQARAKYLDRWMERSAEIKGCECTSMDDICWDDPQIHLEYLLCDPVYCLSLKKESVREEFLAMLSEEEIELFFYRDEEGNSYSDLVRPEVGRALASMVKHRRTSNTS